MTFKLGYPMYYILDDQKNVVPVENDDVLVWARWWEPNRFMADEMIGDVRVVTIMLGIDPDCGTRTPPMMFETAVFGGKYDGTQLQTATYPQAMAQHAQMVEVITKDVD